MKWCWTKSLTKTKQTCFVCEQWQGKDCFWFFLCRCKQITHCFSPYQWHYSLWSYSPSRCFCEKIANQYERLHFAIETISAASKSLIVLSTKTISIHFWIQILVERHFNGWFAECAAFHYFAFERSGNARFHQSAFDWIKQITQFICSLISLFSGTFLALFLLFFVQFLLFGLFKNISVHFDGCCRKKSWVREHL